MKNRREVGITIDSQTGIDIFTRRRKGKRVITTTACLSLDKKEALSLGLALIKAAQS